jgi:hypothetical protein
VTEDAIITKHQGSKPYERNSSMWQGDPTKEFFFLVSRRDQQVTGPLTRAAWEQSSLPSFASLQWATPHNPNFWAPLLGNLALLTFAAIYLRWPMFLVVVVAAVVAFSLLRLRRRRAAA